MAPTLLLLLFLLLLYQFAWDTRYGILTMYSDLNVSGQSRKVLLRLRPYYIRRCPLGCVQGASIYIAFGTCICTKVKCQKMLVFLVRVA
jgi:hypothetical protein